MTLPIEVHLHCHCHERGKAPSPSFPSPSEREGEGEVSVSVYLSYHLFPFHSLSFPLCLYLDVFEKGKGTTPRPDPGKIENIFTIGKAYKLGPIRDSWPQISYSTVKNG